MSKDRIHQAHEIFADQLLRDFRDKITGATVQRLVGQIPEDAYYVGMLSPLEDGDSSESFSSKVFISNMGVDFELPADGIQQTHLYIYPQGNFYYRVLPTYEEQCESMLEAARKDGIDGVETIEDLAAIPQSSDLHVPVTPVFKKVSLHEGSSQGDFCMDLALGDFLDAAHPAMSLQSDGPLADAIDMQMHILNQQLMDDGERYISEIRAQVMVKDLRNADTFHAFLNRSMNRDVVLGTKWSYDVSVRARRQEDRYCISVALLNTSERRASNGKRRRKRNETLSSETLFNAGLKVQVQGAELLPTVMEFFEDDYKYDRNQFAMGVNCSVEVNAAHNEVITNNLPAFTQHRLITLTHGADLRFQAFIDKPVENLKKIHTRMKEILKEWEQDLWSKRAQLTQKGRAQMENEVSGFQAEIHRFQRGIDLIRRDSMVRRSFQLTNEAVHRTNKKYDSWRLFQIVFLVSTIPAITACDEDRTSESDLEKSFLADMSLLYFPTGGGKTEAFLGVLLYNLFFDRFRGKNAGVTCILRYPLRLLSVQQVQRLANMLAQAELLRRGERDIKDTEPFSLGYFVGSENTKNRMTDQDFDDYEAATQEARDQKRIIDVCPFCGQHSVHLKTDRERRRVIHYCDNPGCLSGGELPLYITDNEIYRYLPSAIISTVDKLAIMGNNNNFRNILSGARERCPKHGYTDMGKCLVEGCQHELESVDMVDPAPSLLIQDELHLISESLGAYASHYESFLHFFIEHLSPSHRKVKVIGATATISAYENQVLQLYRKNPILFPAASPYLDHNFYAKIDMQDVQRRLIGYSPYGKALLNSVVYSLKYMRECVYHYRKHPEDMLAIPGIGITTQEEAMQVLSDYWIFLEYNNAKRDNNAVDHALESPVNEELHDENIPMFITEKMTGDSNFQEVRKILARVEGEKDVFDSKAVNMITATSMISHGVDADRFNIMFFFGIPSKMAEYIQAYSRTGRRYSSIVVDIMRPSRETDQSYLKNFPKMHEFKDIFVDDVAINRWASKAIDHTLPGIYMAFVLNYYDAQLDAGTSIYQMNTIKHMMQAGLLPKEEIRDFLYQSYGCMDRGMILSWGGQYKKKIDAFLDKIYQDIPATNWQKCGKEISFFEGFAEMGYPVMNNMRSTEEQVTIELE